MRLNVKLWIVIFLSSLGTKNIFSYMSPPIKYCYTIVNNLQHSIKITIAENGNDITVKIGAGARKLIVNEKDFPINSIKIKAINKLECKNVEASADIYQFPFHNIIGHYLIIFSEPEYPENGDNTFEFYVATHAVYSSCIPPYVRKTPILRELYIFDLKYGYLEKKFESYKNW